jgi:hypothetical protein
VNLELRGQIRSSKSEIRSAFAQTASARQEENRNQKSEIGSPFRAQNRISGGPRTRTRATTILSERWKSASISVDQRLRVIRFAFNSCELVSIRG